MTRSTRLGLVPSLLLLAAFAVPAAADEPWTYSGSTPTGATFNRPAENGGSLSGRIVKFHAQRFVLTANTSCVINGTQNYDGYLHLYRNSFNPASPLTNFVANGGDDDGLLGVGTSDIGTLNLNAGTYILVTSAFNVGQEGSFQNTVRCTTTGVIAHGSCPAYFTVPANINQQICLNNRFIVKIDNISNSATGIGTPVRMGSSDSGIFWFFNDRNWEVLVKVLNGCSINGAHWVFAAATTNQRYTISVADGNTLQIKSYTNPLGVNSPAVTDTNAFATCP
jgi:hypothetical protein